MATNTVVAAEGATLDTAGVVEEVAVAAGTEVVAAVAPLEVVLVAGTEAATRNSKRHHPNSRSSEEAAGAT